MEMYWIIRTCWKDWIFAPVKWLAGKTVSEMTYSSSSGTLNATLSICHSYTLCAMLCALFLLQMYIVVEVYEAS